MTTITAAETAILRALAAQLVELTTTEVTRIAGAALTTARRVKLAAARLIHSVRVGRTYLHLITDDGAALIQGLDAAAMPADRTEAAIRAAYAALGGGAVALADLRDRVAAPRAEVDAALARLARAGAHVRSEADQKTLTDRDHAAAVVLGGTARHTLLIAG
ncbi:hypothetical protein [Nocardia puris]|uniref:Winged helix DNA-binding protein n=1 Tax=Nocardia puris TaxID=208602 RepID=A0A366DCR9_9NOCA|nr:hypothetical protein [Nocardia puris]RBO87048.1 hypothetical protein DFR74_112227 [Nocardia puris]